MEIVIHTNSVDSKKIQQVSKASSDQLLSKFADFDSDNEASPSTADASKRRRSIRILNKKRVVNNNNNNNNSNCINTSNYYGNNVEEYGGSNFNNGSLKVVERKSLLPQQKTKRSSSRGGGMVFKHFGISKSNYVRGGKEFKTKALFCAIDKTWTKAIRGASKVFMEKHYNRHRILIDDIV